MIRTNVTKQKKAGHNIIPLVEWAEEHIILDRGQSLVFEKHQKKILTRAFHVDHVGKVPYSTVIYSCVKKSGKTTTNACVVCWTAFELAPGTEIICGANDQEQAEGRVFRMVKRFIQRNPVLMSRVQAITKFEILLTDGTSIKAIPQDSTGEAGANHSLFSADELWGFTSERSRRLWDELTPVPTLKNSFRFVTTYAGYTGESELLEDLYNRGMAGQRLWARIPCWENGPLFMYWDEQPRMPWQTPAYYQAQKEELRPTAFLRLHKNQWVSSESSLFDMDKWDRCVNKEHRPPLPSKIIRLYVGVDASVKKDRSAVVSVYLDEEGQLKLGPKRFWQPTPEQPMDLEETMESYLLELHQGYRLVTVRYDPYQFHRSATTLMKKGLPMEEYPQTVPNLVDMGQNLYDLVEYQNIVLYPDTELRKEASAAIAKEKDRGLQITKEKSSQKIDQIISLAMACSGATKPKHKEGRVRVIESGTKARAMERDRLPSADMLPVYSAKGKFLGYEPRREEGTENAANLIPVYEGAMLVAYTRAQERQYRGRGIST